MLVAELDLDHAVIHPDRAAIGEGEIISARRQANIIEDKPQILGRDLGADVIFDRLKDLLGSLDAGARWSADVHLNQASIHTRKKVGPDEESQDSRADHHDSGHGRRENPPPQNTLEHPAIKVAEAVELRIECRMKTVEPAGAGTLPFLLLAK